MIGNRILSTPKLMLSAVVSGVIILIFSQCLKIKQVPDARGETYAGSATCINCHKSVYNSYLQTGHYLASHAPDAAFIRHKYLNQDHTYQINKHLKVVMERSGNAFYQSVYHDHQLLEKHQIDVIIGGVKGENYLSWQGNQLHQLPISYSDQLQRLTSSPGFNFSPGDFTRTINRRCMECHSSNISELPVTDFKARQAIMFDQKSLILSVDCERCHGPLADHVDFQTENPEQKQAKYVVQYKGLSRAQKLDACAVCHSGTQSTMLRSTFYFKPGDTLAHYKLPDFTSNASGAVDVHGNQLQLLESSKCFIKSRMDCSSCHNTHVNERGNLMLYTQRCLNCHQPEKHNFCKLAGSLSEAVLKANCIKCHMPQQSSQAITVQTSAQGEKIPIAVTTHRIAVYPEESQKIIAYLKFAGKRSMAK